MLDSALLDNAHVHNFEFHEVNLTWHKTKKKIKQFEVHDKRFQFSKI